jgi:hydroxymethylbilane synthase
MNLRFGVRDDGVSRARATRVADALRSALGAEAPARAGEIVVVPVTVEPEADGAAADADVLVAALRVALVSGECDAVIHDAAALPLEENAELTVVAYLPAREPRLAFCSGGAELGQLAEGDRVITTDKRVAAQVARLREGLVVEVDPGAIATLLGGIEAGEVAAAVAPLADLDLAEIAPPFVSLLSVSEVVPAAGQGVVAIEVRADAPEDVVAVLTALDDPEARATVTAERAAMRGLAAGPTDPVSAHATLAGDDLHLHVRVTNLSGTLALNDESTGLAADPEFLGSNAAKLLIGRGAARLIRMA